jgi:hypothetical protein
MGRQEKDWVLKKMTSVCVGRNDRGYFEEYEWDVVKGLQFMS